MRRALTFVPLVTKLRTTEEVISRFQQVQRSSAHLKPVGCDPKLCRHHAKQREVAPGGCICQKVGFTPDMLDGENMLDLLKLWCVEQEEVNHLQHSAACRAAGNDIDRCQCIAVSNDTHCRQITVWWQHHVDEEHDVDRSPQHLQMCDMESEELSGERQIPVVAMKPASERRVRGSFHCCITVEVIHAAT